MGSRVPRCDCAPYVWPPMTPFSCLLPYPGRRALWAPAGVGAQVMAEPLVPGGRVRFDFAPSLSSWSQRYGMPLEDGARVEEDEELGMDLTDPRGVSLFPGV